MKDAEVVTILLWGKLVFEQKKLKSIYQQIQRYHEQEFPHLPQYSAFVDHCNRVLPQLAYILNFLLVPYAPIRLVDSTMLPVCKPHRADSYRVARDVTALGKNHQGYHYGFKLHTAVDLKGRLAALWFTPADIYDSKVLLKLTDHSTRVVAGDTLYGDKGMGEKLYRHHGTVVVSPPFPKQNKKLITQWQNNLLNFRAKIESCFDHMKEHLNLVTSFPRSATGYFVHYCSVLIAYQLQVL